MTAHERPAWAIRLQAEREARCWSKAEMARRLLAAAGQSVPPVESLRRQVLGWESGEHFPRDWAAAYAVAFGLPEDELFPDASVSRTDERRAGASILTPVRHTGPVAPELVDYFKSQLPGHYQADRLLGPLHLIPTLAAQVSLIWDLVADAEERVRRDLLRVGVAYTALLGWLHQDAGNMAEAARWLDLALGMAHRSADAQILSYALSNKAMHAADAPDGRAVVDYAQAARSGSGLSPKVKVLALQHEAHGRSLTDGTRRQVDELLGEAAPLVAQIDDDYPWGNACRRTPHYLDVQRATCYGRLGLANEAADLWDGILSAMTSDGRRDRAVFRARHAAALADCGEPEGVLEIVADVVSAVGTTGSARLRRELLGLPGHAVQWAETKHGRDLAEMIAVIA